MKKTITVNVDIEALENCKKNLYNISELCNDALHEKEEKIIKKIKIEPLPCFRCSKIIEKGYYCPERNFVQCEECQAKDDMLSCPHDKNGEHAHYRWGDWTDEKFRYSPRKINPENIEKIKKGEITIKTDERPRPILGLLEEKKEEVTEDGFIKV